MKVLLTGGLRVGKSTVVERVLELWPDSFGGFRTIRCPGGYKIVDLATGQAALIARNGKSGLIQYPAAFEEVGVAAIARALDSKDLVVMDELGFLELAAPRFQEAVLAALRGAKPVLGVVKQERNPFLDKIRALQEITLVEVRKENRDLLPIEIARLLMAAPSRR
ncbi:MAG: nucleoside-triphosphatase [Candidatus Acetothermia bacterium]|jgi:nucleoside-triphosphatase|nr:nucleoside-triphosphatase [Candidatus Acetothermia bacterium]MDH7505123.1 nucleoside-triphosphatase [Candidatus Acetothermia bacterium]